jgi:hypothetical protein
MVSWENISRLASAHINENPASSEDALKRFLTFWFCSTYNIPLKDPILEIYSLEELCYEYLWKHHLIEAPLTKAKAKQTAAADSDAAWIREQTKIMLEKAQKQAEAEQAEKKQPIPTITPINASFADKP